METLPTKLQKSPSKKATVESSAVTQPEQVVSGVAAPKLKETSGSRVERLRFLRSPGSIPPCGRRTGPQHSTSFSNGSHLNLSRPILSL